MRAFVSLRAQNRLINPRYASSHLSRILVVFTATTLCLTNVAYPARLSSTIEDGYQAAPISLRGGSVASIWSSRPPPPPPPYKRSGFGEDAAIISKLSADPTAHTNLGSPKIHLPLGADFSVPPVAQVSTRAGGEQGMADGSKGLGFTGLATGMLPYPSASVSLGDMPMLTLRNSGGPSGGSMNTGTSPLPRIPFGGSGGSAAVGEGEGLIGEYAKVVARVRPLTEAEREELRVSPVNPPQSSLSPSHSTPTGNVLCLPEKREVILARSSSSSLNIPSAPRTYVFDDAFTEGASQEEVYRRAIHKYVTDALAGYEVAVIAVGSTGSGKTYTLEGKGGLGVGAAPRAVAEIFRSLPSEMGASDSPCVVRVRYVEISEDDVITDLLPSAGDIQGDGDMGGSLSTFSRSLSITQAESPAAFQNMASVQEATQALHIASQRPRQEGSHRLLTIQVQAPTHKTLESTHIAKGSITFADLAPTEAPRPNLGLDGLREVVNHVIQHPLNDPSPKPYETSAVTTLVRKALGGDGKLLVIATLSPNPTHAEVTLETLQLAYDLRSVKNTPKRHRPKTERERYEAAEKEAASLKEQLRLQRAREGVYLPPDMYESMAREMSMHSVRISDVEARLRIEQRKAETKQSEVDAMEVRATEAEANATSLATKLRDLQQELDEEKGRAKERSSMLELYQEMQPKLYARAQDIQNTLKRVAAYASRLEGKVRNQTHATAFHREQAQIAAQAALSAIERIKNYTNYHEMSQRFQIGRLRSLIQTRQQDLNEATEEAKKAIEFSADNIVQILRQHEDTTQAFARSEASRWKEVSGIGEREKDGIRFELHQLISGVNASVCGLREKIRDTGQRERAWVQGLEDSGVERAALAEGMLREHATTISQIGDVLTSAQSQSQISAAKRARRVGEYVHEERKHIRRVVERVVGDLGSIISRALQDQYQRSLGLINDDTISANASDANLFSAIQDVSKRMGGLRNTTNAWGREVIASNLKHQDDIGHHKRYYDGAQASADQESQDVLLSTIKWAQGLNTGVGGTHEALQSLTSSARGDLDEYMRKQAQTVRQATEFLHSGAIEIFRQNSNGLRRAKNGTIEADGILGSVIAREKSMASQMASELVSLGTTENSVLGHKETIGADCAKEDESTYSASPTIALKPLKPIA